MLRALSFSLAALFLAVLVVQAAPDAHANGILVTGDEPTAPTVRRRPPPHWHPRPQPPVRLKGHRVSATLNGQVAEVTVEQTFHNHSGAQLEGTYLFPLPEGAVISRFAMTMFGKMIEGEIIEREQARRIYQSIVSRRRDPGLLEYMGRGLFRARVFPIMPHKDLTIRLTFQQVLPDNEGTLEFRYPLATDRLNSDAVQDAIVDVKIESDVDLKAIYSPSHKVDIKRDGDRKARVTYERSGKKQDKDFLLFVGRSPDAVGFSLQSHKAVGEDGTFMAVLAPRVKVPEGERVPKDVVYVVDTSGSMVGDKMHQARKALAYGVQKLRKGDRFNIIGFSTGIYPFRDNLLAATEEAQKSAVKWIEALEARGGTNIEEALTTALAMKRDDRLFMVVFLTDGRPTIGERQTEPLLKMIQKANASNARVFTFGVGTDLDVRLLDRLAEVTNGTRDYVMENESIEIVTGRFFNKVDQPVLSDVKVEFGPGTYDIYPRKLPDLFAGSQVVVFGRYKEADDRVIRLTGKVGNKEVVYEYEGTLRKGEGAGYLPRLWAYRKVAFMLDEIRLHGHSQELVDAIVKLATKHAIVTPYTAGLVVEDSEMQNVNLRLEARFRAPGRRGAGRARDGFGGPTAGIPMPNAAAPGSGGGGAASSPAAEKKAPEDSAKLKRLKHDASEEEIDDKDGLEELRARIKAVAGRTFTMRDDGRWVDTAWKAKTPTTKIEAYSEKYFELLAKSDTLAKIFALGERVVFKHGDTFYEIVPAK